MSAPSAAPSKAITPSAKSPPASKCARPASAAGRFTTTLAALIDYLNVNLARHVVTIEQPIEFVHRNKKSLITQREVPTNTPSRVRSNSFLS